MAGKFNEYKSINWAQVGTDVLDWWKNNQVFEKSVEVREGMPSFTFYEGPPSANGTPGIHHVMARTVKDIVCRYKTMKGFQVKRKGGWDTHGLPVELQVEKKLGITKEDIGKKITVEEYNRLCRESVMEFKEQWDDLTEKMGYWVDLNNPYITFDNNYIESLWHLLKELYKKDYLYKGYTIQPYSPAAGTGLSSHELNQPGCYKDVKDTSVVAQFKTKNLDKFIDTFGANDSCYILAWTTTPWTLPSNSALAVGEKIDYVLVKTFNPYTFQPVHVVVAKDLLHKYVHEKGAEASFDEYKGGDKIIPWQILTAFKGKDILGVEYEQLMPYVQPAAPAFKVISGDFVSTEDGTGIVHIAPTFGADDARVAKLAGIPAITVKDEAGNDVPLVNKQGKFVLQVTDFALEPVKEAYLTDDEKEAARQVQGRDKYLNVDERISIKLKTENKAFKVERYEHNYPHCWRTDKPILYYPLESWFIRTTAVKDRLVELNKTINWKPESTGAGRFGNWLENLVDWNLSRSRYWGTPLPIWRTKITPLDYEDNLKCVGSIGELLNNNNWKYVSPEFDLFLSSIKEDLFSNQLYLENLEVFVKLNQVPSDNWLKYFENNKNSINSFAKLVEIGFPYSLLKKFLINIPVDIDLHKPYVDRIVYVEELNGSLIITNNGQSIVITHRVFEREPDLIDVWFDSGAMPYAQWHWPFENKDVFEKNFPADFIAEGVDQTRGWFFTLHAISVMLFDSIAFKNVIANGLVLDKNGNKMSKRFGNAIDPFETIASFGPDATRWYMITNAPPWDNLKFNIDGVGESQRRFFSTFYNTYNFFALYANLDNFSFSEPSIPLDKRTESDRWILSRLHSLIQQTSAAYDDYDLTKAGRLIQEYVIDDLSNWYVRLNRKRFWKGQYAEDKIAAYQTLSECLLTLAKLSAPIAPFYFEKVYQDLNNTMNTEKALSVHTSLFPVSDPQVIDVALEERMAYAQRICSLVHSLRKGKSIRVRLPLQKILLPILNDTFRKQIELVQDLIQNEVNIKSIEYLDDNTSVLVKKVKPNFKKLGQQFGPKMKLVAEAITSMTQEQISAAEKNGTFTLLVDNEQVSLTTDDLEIAFEDIPGWLVAKDDTLTVALDITVNDTLRKEGIARDLVNRTQNIRKDMGLEIQDKIRITVQRQDALINAALESFSDYICHETQALELNLVASLADGKEVELDECTLVMKIEA